MYQYLDVIITGLLLAVFVGLVTRRKSLAQANITKWKIDKQSRHYRWTTWWLRYSFWDTGRDYDGESRFQPKSLCTYFWWMIGCPFTTLFTGCAFSVMIGVATTVGAVIFLGPVSWAIWKYIDPTMNWCDDDVPVAEIVECTWIVTNNVLGIAVGIQVAIWIMCWRAWTDRAPIPVIGSAVSVSWEFAKSMKYGVCPRLEYFDPIVDAKDKARHKLQKKLERAMRTELKTKRSIEPEFKLKSKRKTKAKKK